MVTQPGVRLGGDSTSVEVTSITTSRVGGGGVGCDHGDRVSGAVGSPLNHSPHNPHYNTMVALSGGRATGGSPHALNMLPPSPLAPFSPTQQLKAQLGVANHANGSLRHPSSRVSGSEQGSAPSSSSPSSSSSVNNPSSRNQSHTHVGTGSGPASCSDGTGLGHGNGGVNGGVGASSSSRSSSRGGSPRNANNDRQQSGNLASKGNNDNGGSGHNGGSGGDGNGVYGWENTYQSDDPSTIDTNTTPVVPTLPEEVSFLKTFFPHSHCLYVDPATVTMRADLKDHPFQTAAAILPGGEW